MKYNMSNMANLLVMDTAMQGENDAHGPLTWYWKIVGKYALVYMENLDNHTDYYRVFRCRDKGYYERKMAFNPSYTDEEYKCIYDSTEKDGRREILHSVEEEWMGRVQFELR